MLLKTNNRNERGTLYIGLIEVSSKSGGTWDIVSFAKRASNDDVAKEWHEKLLDAAHIGKWNIWNTQDLLHLGDFLNKHFEFVPTTTAGHDTLEFGFSKRDPRLKEWVERKNGCTSYHLIPCKVNVIENPAIILAGGWDPHITCDPAGGVCDISWNCGSRKDPEECKTKIAYKKQPIVITTHDGPGTVSRVTYYIWEFPGMEVLDERVHK